MGARERCLKCYMETNSCIDEYPPQPLLIDNHPNTLIYCHWIRYSPNIICDNISVIQTWHSQHLFDLDDRVIARVMKVLTFQQLKTLNLRLEIKYYQNLAN